MTSQLVFLYRRHRRGPRRWWAWLVALLVALAGFATAQAAPVCTTNGNQGICTFTYTGAAERWVVPPHATQATFDLYGAQGGGYRGQGGRVTAQFTVTPGAVYQINVGGQGGVLGGGFNGGGQGGDGEGTDDGAGGGGASDVRTGSFALVDRILVAGGGGGSGGKILGADGGFGGAGGYPSGENGGDGEDRGTPIPGGGGGSQLNGVPIGGAGASNGGAGGVGVGGNGGSDISSGQGGGGGGGGYGGGGGGAAYPRGGGAGSGGGGGSSYGPAGATFENGVRAGHGLVIITYSLESTPPVADPVQDPPANAYGWNNGNVQVQWRWSDSGSGLDPANCANSTLVTAEGRTELTQTCQDRVGNVGSATYTVQIDKSRPTANLTVSPAANANDWHNSDVTVTWNWSDPAPGAGVAAGLDAANCPAAATSRGEGSRTLNSDCADLAANRANQSYTVNVDKTAPVVTVTGVSNGAVYALGSVPVAGCITTDGRAGVATPATLSVTGGDGDGSGLFTATCSGATDLADNNTAPVSVSYTVNAPTPTNTPLPPTATNTSVPPTATATSTPVPPTATVTNTLVPPTATNTAVPPTATATNTSVPPTATVTNTLVPPTMTNTAVPPTMTNTAVPPTMTNTAVPPTMTNTALPPTMTNTALPPTMTNTPVPPTAMPTVQATLPANLYTTVQQVRSNLAVLLPSGDHKTDQALQKAIAKLDQGLAPVFWQVPDGNQLSTQGEKAFHRLRDAIKALCKLKPPPTAVTVDIDTLTGVGRTLADQAISAATTAGGNAKQLAKANQEMSKAQQDLAKQRPDLAFSHYEEAWEAAQAALGIVLAAAEPEDAPLDEDTADVDHVHAEDAAESHADRQINQLFLPLINR